MYFFSIDKNSKNHLYNNCFIGTSGFSEAK